VINPNGHVVVVGGSIAGVTAAEELRTLGFDGTIDILETEAGNPYARPPLSKAVLAGLETPEDTWLPEFGHLGIALRSGTHVTGLDIDNKRIRVNGDELAYDGLIIAAGARAATLKDLGANPGNLPETALRTLSDAIELRKAFSYTQTVVIVGGGILGMEIASTAATMGLSVTVVDRVPAMLPSVGPHLSGIVMARAAQAGVDFRIAPEGAHLEGTADAPRVHTATEVFEGDLVVSAVGCRPNIEWLVDSGLDIAPGLVVDDRCRVSQHIVAAGDITSVAGARRRPHWSNALDQARTAAAALLLGDEGSALSHRPYFWTDQFGLSLKVAGEGPFDDAPELVDGSEEELAAVFRWSHDGQPFAAAALNRRIPISRLHAYAGQN
jgi:NADPH-dependent 2,4-dienoyl-CoA reductase/sulfur reductase-like enzyme